MKKNRCVNILIVLCSLIVFVACSKDSKPISQQESRQKEISDYSNSLADGSFVVDKQKADTLIKMYADYVKDYPKDTISEFYLFQMASVYANVGNCKKAIECLSRMIQDYPNGTKIGAAYFFKGVYYKELCGNVEKSREAFQEYIERYPNNSHVEDAKRMMQMDTMQNPVDIVK
ncbi:MAG: tetratricopeptide repeat protein [Bacteroidales bacterium]|nr:tetratricopeptide repeat protein [Bacteroidales bacterium]